MFGKQRALIFCSFSSQLYLVQCLFRNGVAMNHFSSSFGLYTDVLAFNLSLMMKCCQTVFKDFMSYKLQLVTQIMHGL